MVTLPCVCVGSDGRRVRADELTKLSPNATFGGPKAGGGVRVACADGAGAHKGPWRVDCARWAAQVTPPSPTTTNFVAEGRRPPRGCGGV